MSSNLSSGSVGNIKILKKYGDNCILIINSSGTLIKFTDYGYKNPSIAQSPKINNNSESEQIVSATLNTTTYAPTNTLINFYLSANGGQNWEQIISNQKYNFLNKGNDLRWKAELKNTSGYGYLNMTPKILNLSVTYETEMAPSAYIKVVSPNGGEKFEKGKDIQIKFEYSGIDQFKPELYYSSSKYCVLYRQLSAINTTSSPTTYTINLPTDCGEGLYKLRLFGFKNNQIVVQDDSDNYIEVITSSVVENIPDLIIDRIELGVIENGQFVLKNPKGNEHYALRTIIKNIGSVSNVSSFAIYWNIPNSNTGSRYYDLLIAPNESKTILLPFPDGQGIVAGNYIATITIDFQKTITESNENNNVLSFDFNIAIAENDLIKTTDFPDVFVIKGGKKVKIKDPHEFEQKGYKWENVQQIKVDLFSQIEELKKEIVILREELKKAGTLIKNPNSPEVYVITPEGKKEHISSPEEFSQKGYKWNQIKTVTQDEISQIPDFTPSQKQEGIYPNGTLIKAENDPTVYIIVNGKKKPIPDPATFNNLGLKWDQIKEVPASQAGQFEDIKVSSDIVRAQGDNKIYRIIGDKKLWIPTVQAFLGSGYKPNSEIDITQDELSDFEDVAYIKVKGGRYVYEIKENKKYRITDTSQIPAQDIKPVTLAEFTAYPIGK